ncbi:serine/threonine protein kinase [Legionella busanensis]|uniref:Serine/threonine protein kinase n=1 Tax=Legionella busanensis TaxID=190655 RepID=A0A378JP96_9GAMM|nr:protein kinase [Legionella busanensis]STX49952.1 serine/threonine protein kinase [Legionella busanensis]
MQTRRNKDTIQEFTTITTAQGAYELWNSLTAEQENLVLEQLSLEKGSLPTSKKDAQRQRLLFNQGTFGKVRLAQKEGKFLAVKKLDIKSDEDREALFKEYDFGRILKAANIPHVAYSTDGIISTDAQGHERLYLFMDNVAALGDGENLKKLISYLPSEEKRTAVLRHAARSLLEAAAKMQKQQIYHRDIKASNLLVSATGEIYLADFGSASTSNAGLIAAALNQSGNEYAVSSVSDRRYFPPEFHIAMTLGQPLPNTTVPGDALHDNWRLGLTLLQLCGVIKEGEGLLRPPYNTNDEFGNLQLGWIEELKQNTRGKPLDKLILEHFNTELKKIKSESLHKIPAELQPVIFGLLEIDPEKRRIAAQALALLPPITEAQERNVAEGFKVIVHNQVAVSVKNKIRKALKEEAKESSDGQQWINNALQAFKNLIQHPDTTPPDIQNFINSWILNNKNRPDLSFEHFEAMLDRERGKPIKATQTPEINAPNTHTEEISTFPDEDPVLNRLKNAFIKAADELITYSQSKAETKDSSSEIETIIDSMKKGVKRIKKLLSSKSINIITPPEPNSMGPTDESALAIVTARIEQIVTQLTFGKMLQFDDKALEAVYSMLTKDKRFLEGIVNKVSNGGKIGELLHSINKKMESLHKISQRQYFLVSSNPIEDVAYLEKVTGATYVANNDDTKAQFTFTKTPNNTAYELPLKLTDDVRSFVANRTIKEMKKAKSIYIYASQGQVGKAIAQTISQVGYNNKNLNIYVNDELISVKNHQSKGKLFGFFGEKVKSTHTEQHEKFTVKEIGNEDRVLRQ